MMDELTIKTGAAIEAVKAMLAAMKEAEVDPRGLAVARTQFETAFLWVANAAGGDPVF
ncbi:hypothetical protein [Novosphingobium huizhouense]|uniref:hypothetical protein n=1 Tax=Novosphingobium huizhouense TaxID=2866625 RepID=UPI001CD878EE|nr:hypothetical protein [Novosphingobium huizhouense]